MIISHKHKFIFLKTRKTAGTSFEIALGDICGPKDIVTRISMKDEIERRKNYRGAQNYRLPLKIYSSKDWKKLLTEGRFKRFENHDTAEKIVSIIGEKKWNEYFKFCFERNPWDKMVSQFYWKKEEYQLASFEEFWDRGLAGEVLEFSETIHTREQYSLNGEIAVDKIYKYEEMKTALADLTEKFKLEKPLEMPSYKAKGGHRSEKAHYRDLLSEEMADEIGKLCAPEIKLLNYEF